MRPGYAPIVHAVNLEPVSTTDISSRPIFCRAVLMQVSCHRTSHEGFDGGAPHQVAGHDLMLDEGPYRGRIADFATKRDRRINAFISAGSENMLATISTGIGWIWPGDAGVSSAAQANDYDAAGGEKWASVEQLARPAPPAARAEYGAPYYAQG
jgi:hypothetical protein